MKKLFTVLISVILIISALPLSALAALASDIPEEMLDNAYLEALAYTGYNVEQQKSDGTIFIKYSNNAPKSILSGITYNSVNSGLETIVAGTPDIEKFRDSGLCCASYVSYVYFNYLPNVAHIDTSAFQCPSNPRSAAAYNTAANEWVENDKARRIAFTQNANGSNFTANEGIPLGSLVVFKNISSGAVAHVAIYAGFYNGHHFVTHVGNDNGPEICTIDGMSKGGSPEAVVQIVAPRVTKENGLIEIYKTDTKGSKLSGAYFIATSVSNSAKHYLIGPTDENGYAVTDERLPYGKYTVRETVFPTGYTASGQSKWVVNVDSENKGVVRINAVNALKKFRVSVTKSDIETGTAQGDATLKGAVYGIYKDNSLIDSYTTDGNGQFITGYYACGDNWTVKEISPSKGYLLDDTVYPINASQDLFVAELNTINLNVTETVIKGSISIIKHSDDGTTQIETPEADAEFDVFLKSSGSYEQAKATESDHIICDNDGFAKTKQLPYGAYIVHQTKGTENTQKMNDFDVEVIENGKVYSYIINDAVISASVKIVKKDAETDKVIPVSGIGFKVRSLSTGEYISQHISYPAPVDIDVFYTDSTGSLMLPEKLTYGDYEIIEQTTANGYVLDQTPVAFTVDGTKETVVAQKSNIPQKGVIQIEKTGEMFTSVKEENGLFIPVYSEKGLASAKFEIKADEDIYTADGTLRFAKDTIVDTVVTNVDGKAESIPLYLGKYSVTEIETPDGFVLDRMPKAVALTYAGQEISVTSATLLINNNRQKAEISLTKELEQNEIFKLGGKEQYKNVIFGLFANQKITAADGTFIPTDGLLEVAHCNENGEIIFTADIPFGKYYVREIQTDNHYILNETKYPIEFTYAGQETTTVIISVNNGLLIKNSLLRGSVTTTKVDRDYPENKLSGAVFEIYADGNGNGVFDDGTDILVGEMTETETGIYTLKNLVCGEYFLYEKTAPIGFIRDRAYYLFEITDENIVSVTNNAGTGFYNKPIHSDTPISPKTGDSSDLLLYSIVLLLSGFSLAAAIKNKKTKHERKLTK